MDVAGQFSPNQPVYMMSYPLTITFFFYTALVLNDKQTADNLKKTGAFVPCGWIDRALDQHGPDAVDAGRRGPFVVIALLPEFLVLCWKRTVLLWGNVTVDCHFRDDGFHGVGASPRYTASV